MRLPIQASVLPQADSAAAAGRVTQSSIEPSQCHAVYNPRRNNCTFVGGHCPQGTVPSANPPHCHCNCVPLYPNGVVGGHGGGGGAAAAA